MMSYLMSYDVKRFHVLSAGRCKAKLRQGLQKNGQFGKLRCFASSVTMMNWEVMSKPMFPNSTRRVDSRGLFGLR
jgi:hypothetical protein